MTQAEPDSSTLTSLRRALLRWYRQSHRTLPWRALPGQRANPYHVLVSEAMLQQTQVATVVDYFHRFVARFPDVRTLARADEQQVLRLWQGLGYYRRARHLHAAAKMIVQRHAGRVPDTVDQLLQLPGVGRYTAGAVASIAYGRVSPIVDGNVARVLARWFALNEVIDTPEAQRRLWSLASMLPPKHAAGDFNQAMMELGALVCTPRQPGCLTCPMRSCCRAYGQGKAESLPRRGARRKPTNVTHHIFAVRRGDQYFFQQRPDSGLWSKMWQMPTWEEPAKGRTLDAAAVTAWMVRQGGPGIDTLVRVHQFAHQTTHRTIAFHLWSCGCKNRAGSAGTAGLWRGLDDLDDLALANPQRLAVKRLLAGPVSFPDGSVDTA